MEKNNINEKARKAYQTTFYNMLYVNFYWFYFQVTEKF